MAGNGVVWGVVIFPSQDQLTLLSGSGDEKQDYIDATRNIHVVRTADRGLSPVDQARALLRWERPQEPELTASLKVLDLANPGRVDLGPNLAPGAGSSAAAWNATAGAKIDSGNVALVPDASHPEVDASFMAPIQGGTDYLIQFDRTCKFDGLQKAYAIAFDPTGHPLVTFPSGSGYSCPQSDSPAQSFFAFQAPPSSAWVEVLLRGYAPGQAQVTGMRLSSMSETL
jgi:hypothetical protein